VFFFIQHIKQIEHSLINEVFENLIVSVLDVCLLQCV